MAGSLPPTLSMMKDIGGVEMPEFFGRLLEETQAKDSEEAEAVEADASADSGEEADNSDEEATPQEPTSAD